MKVTQHGSDIELDFFVTSNDRRCDETIQLGRPISNNDENATKECCIVLETGDQVQVIGHVSGTFLQARIDLLVDGTFVGERTVEPPKHSIEPKTHNKRRIEFKTVCSFEGAYEDSSLPRAVDGEMIAQAIPPDIEPSQLVGVGEAYGVGSIVVLISVESDLSCGYTPNKAEYPDCTIGSWLDRKTEVREPGTLPTHSIALRTTSEIIKQRSNLMYRRCHGPRPGHAPFAKLIFNYRDQATLSQARVIAAPLRSYPVHRQKVEANPINSPPSKIHADFEYDADMAPAFALRQAFMRDFHTTIDWDQLVSVYEHDRTSHQAAEHSVLPQLNWTDVKVEDDDDGVAIEIGGQEFVLPSTNKIQDMIPKHGRCITGLLNLLMPQLEREHRIQAAKLFLLYMRDSVALRHDQEGRQLLVKRGHLEELERLSALVLQAMARRQAVSRGTKRHATAISNGQSNPKRARA